MTPWTVARQAPLSIEFSRQEYWSRLPFPYIEDLPNPGIEPCSLVLQAYSLLSEPQGKSLDYMVYTITATNDVNWLPIYIKKNFTHSSLIYGLFTVIFFFLRLMLIFGRKQNSVKQLSFN